MFLLTQILPAVVIAMMTSAGVCLLAVFLGRERFRCVAIPLAIGTAYAAGHLFTTGAVSFPPADTTNWLPCFAVTASIVGALGSMSRARGRWGFAVFATLALGGMRLLLRPKFQYTWSPIQGWAWVAGLGIALVLQAIILNALVRRSETAAEVPGLLLLICAGTFMTLLLSGSVLLGQFAAILGAALFGTLVLCFRNAWAGQGLVPIFALMQGALLVSGYFFSALPALSAALLAFAPLLALIQVRLTNRFLNLGIRAGLILLPVAAAVVVAYSSSPPLDY